jgi:hypothetical protein
MESESVARAATIAQQAIATLREAMDRARLVTSTNGTMTFQEAANGTMRESTNGASRECAPQTTTRAAQTQSSRGTQTPVPAAGGRSGALRPHSQEQAWRASLRRPW